MTEQSKLSEFIRKKSIRTVDNPHLYKLISDGLQRLHLVFGYDYDWDDPDKWVLEELDQFIESTEITPEQLLDSVDESLNLIVNSIDDSLLTDVTIINDEKPVVRFDGLITNRSGKPLKKKKSLFKYPDKPLFRLNGKVIVDQHYYIIPLTLGLNQLITLIDDKTPDLESVVMATRLIECSEKIRLLVNINILWICESQKNYNPDKMNQRSAKFDSDPNNIKKKDVLRKMVSEIIEDNPDTDKPQLIKIINTRVKLSDLELSPSVLKRWVSEILNEQ